MFFNLFLVLPLLSMPGGGEWIIILIAIVVLFGGKKIPELAKGLGKGIRDFNDAKQGVKDDIESGMRSSNTQQTPTNTTMNDNSNVVKETPTAVKES